MTLGKSYEAIVYRNPVFNRTHDGMVDRVKKGSETACHKALFSAYFELEYTRTNETQEVVDGEGEKHTATVFLFSHIRPTVSSYGRLTRRQMKNK